MALRAKRGSEKISFNDILAIFDEVLAEKNVQKYFLKVLTDFLKPEIVRAHTVKHRTH